MLSKYPRTLHLPFSPGKGKDDKVVTNCDHLLNKPIVITEKLDGGNCTITELNEVYARSINGQATHPSFDFIKNFVATYKPTIDSGFTAICENMYAVHSIKYTKLEQYFYIICHIWNKTQDVAPWYQTRMLAFAPVVPELYEGTLTSAQELEELINRLMSAGSKVGGEQIEGVVVRDAYRFPLKDFKHHVAKYVREDHVQPNEKHWTRRKMEKNGRT